MEHRERIQEIEYKLDDLLELHSRSHILNELFEYSSGRVEYYRSKLQGKPVPSLYDGIKDNGEISDELFSIYMKRQYVSFCQYLEQCLSDVDKEFENLTQKNNEYFGKK